MPASLISIAAVFVPLSLVTIGGGASAIADIHRQVVDIHHWLTESQFVDTYAISRMAPGPGSLFVTLIGWQIAGFWGAVVATMSIFGPTAFLIYGVAHIWKRHQGSHLLTAFEDGLRPVAAGMIMAAVYVLLQALNGGWPARVMAVASAALLLRTRVNPLLLIGTGAGIYLGLHAIGL